MRLEEILRQIVVDTSSISSSVSSLLVFCGHGKLVTRTKDLLLISSSTSSQKTTTLKNESKYVSVVDVIISQSIIRCVFVHNTNTNTNIIKENDKNDNNNNNLSSMLLLLPSIITAFGASVFPSFSVCELVLKKTRSNIVSSPTTTINSSSPLKSHSTETISTSSSSSEETFFSKDFFNTITKAIDPVNSPFVLMQTEKASSTINDPFLPPLDSTTTTTTTLTSSPLRIRSLDFARDFSEFSSFPSASASAATTSFSTTLGSSNSNQIRKTTESVVICELPTDFLCQECFDHKQQNQQPEYSSSSSSCHIQSLKSLIDLLVVSANEKRRNFHNNAQNGSNNSSGVQKRRIEEQVKRSLDFVLNAEEMIETIIKQKNNMKSSNLKSNLNKKSDEKQWSEWFVNRLQKTNSNSSTTTTTKQISDHSREILSSMLFSSLSTKKIEQQEENTNNNNNNNKIVEIDQMTKNLSKLFSQNSSSSSSTLFDRTIRQQVSSSSRNLNLKIKSSSNELLSSRKSEREELSLEAHDDIDDEYDGETEAILRALTEKKESMTLTKRAEEFLAHVSTQPVPTPLRNIALALPSNLRFWLTPMGFIVIGTCFMMLLGTAFLFAS